MSAVMPLNRRNCCPHEIQKKIHSNGKIRAVKKASPVLLDQLADACQLGVPAGRAHDHVLSRCNGGVNVVEDAVGCGEIDDQVNGGQLLFCQGGGVCVVR